MQIFRAAGLKEADFRKEHEIEKNAEALTKIYNKKKLAAEAQIKANKEQAQQ